MAYNFSSLEQKIKETKEWLRGEYFGIRSGQATPAILDSIKVDSYGVSVPINQVANIGIEDARTLRVTPFNASQVKEIEKALLSADTGLSVSSSDKGVRVSFPELTAETRSQLTKVVREKLEQARVSVRKERDEVWAEIQKQEKDGVLSEDEKFTHKDEMQKIVDEANKALEALSNVKEVELKG